MKTIRIGVFETNSSSTHSISIMTKEEYENWEDNSNIKYNPYEDVFRENEEEEDDLFTYDQYVEDEYLEVDINHYTTKSGEEIVIICKHGYNG